MRLLLTFSAAIAIASATGLPRTARDALPRAEAAAAAAAAAPALAAPAFKMPFDAALHPPLTGGPHRQGVFPNCATAKQPVSTVSGIDIGLPPVTPVLAVADGYVLDVPPFDAGGFGYSVRTEHGGTAFTYAHLSSIRPWVKSGVPIKQGDILGASGDSGAAKNHPHLHLDIADASGAVTWNGKNIDGYTVWAEVLSANQGTAINYSGSLTKGSTSLSVDPFPCDPAAPPNDPCAARVCSYVVGSTETVVSDPRVGCGAGANAVPNCRTGITSTNQMHEHANNQTNGTLLGQVAFKTPCPSGIGVGVAFDGTNLWYSCYASSPDLYKASPTTGQVLASYNVAGGLGALAWDEGRKKIWAGAGCGTNQTGAEIYLIDPARGTGAVEVRVPNFSGSCLDDGLAYDGSNDTLYHSFDGATAIRHVSAVAGSPVADDRFAWAGNGCYNSGLAIGGDLLYEGSDGCTHIWVVDKNTKAHQFDFASPGLRDEGMSCDSSTFPGLTAMWSKDAYNNTAYAFAIPLGSCNFGGKPQPNRPARRIYYIQGIASHSSCGAGALNGDGFLNNAPAWINPVLDPNSQQSLVRGSVSVTGFQYFSYANNYSCANGVPSYQPGDTCNGIGTPAVQLKNYIDSTLKPGEKATIIAHSMGGLIASLIIAAQPQWASGNIASVVTFDSPLDGLDDVRAHVAGSPTCTWPDQSKVDMCLTCPENFPPVDIEVAQHAGGHVPFYTIDATKPEQLFDVIPLIEAVPGASTHMPGERLHLESNETHGGVWDNPTDQKKQFVACATVGALACNFAVGAATQGAATQTQMAVGPAANRVQFTSSFGSIVRMTLISPDGTVYGPDGAGPVLSYHVDAVSEAYEIQNPAPGLWTIKLNGIEVPGGTEDVPLSLFVESLSQSATMSLSFGHVTSAGTNDDSDAGAINGTTARLNGSGTLQSLSVYVGQTSPGAHLRMALYALDSSGHPGQLLAQTGEVAATMGWDTIPVPAGTTLTPGVYWIVAQTDDPHTVYRVASAGPATSVGWAYQAYGAFPAAVTGWLDFGSQALDMYGTVTPSQLAFGHVTSGGTNDDSDVGAINGTTARLNGSGTLQSLSVFVGQTSPGAHLRMALYALDSSGHPGQLLAQTGEVAATAGWDTIPVPAGTTLTPGEYWVVAQTDDPHTVYRVASAGPGSSVGWSYQAYGAFPAAVTGWLDFGSQAFDMYGTVTASQLAFGHVTSAGTNDDSDVGAINGTTARLNGSGTLQSLSVYVGQTSPGAHLRMALYALDSSGHPGQLLTQTGEVAATMGWNTIPVPAGTTLTPGEYWITAQTDDPHTVYRVASAGPASSVGWSYRAYGAFPAAITGWLDFGSQAFDMYATLN